MIEKVDLPIFLIMDFDPRITYLFKRFADQSQRVTCLNIAAFIKDEVIRIAPRYLLFPSLETYRNHKDESESPEFDDVQILVCASQGEEEIANSLGVTHVFIHPITYKKFLSVV